MADPTFPHFAARFYLFTGGRLTRYTEDVLECASADEAVAAISAPFATKGYADAQAVEFTSPGHCRIIATRRNGKPLVRKSA